MVLGPGFVFGERPEAVSGVAVYAADKVAWATWRPAWGARTFTVMRSERAGGPAVPVAREQRATVWRDDGVANGKGHFYSVVGVNPNGGGTTSNAVVARPRGLDVPPRIELALPRGAKLACALIPAGEFTMGSPPTEIGHRDDEILHHAVITRAFYFGEFEVTQERYAAVMGLNPAAVPGGSYYDARNIGSQKPVNHVTFSDCEEFCR
jgi:hypothetical protein